MATPVPPIHVLKRQAKRLRDDLRRSEAASIARARAVYHDLRDIPDEQVGQRMALNRCLHILACELGFQTWEGLLAAHQAQMSGREPIVVADEPDITVVPPFLQPGQYVDGLTGQIRQAPPEIVSGIMQDAATFVMGGARQDTGRRWSPSIRHPSFARYASATANPGREAWSALLTDVATWAAGHHLGMGWPRPMEPDPGGNVPKSFSEVIYEFDICAIDPANLGRHPFDRTAFEAAFANRIRLIEIFPLYNLLHGTPEAAQPGPADRHPADFVPLYGTSRGGPGVQLLRHRDGSAFRFNPFAIGPSPGETRGAAGWGTGEAPATGDQPDDEDQDADSDVERKELAEEMRSTPLSDEQLQETRDFLHDSLGIEPTDDQIRAIIPPGSETHGIICAYGVEGDTATRDEIADRFCEHLVGRPHPLNGDRLTDAQLDAFAKQVIAAAKKAGMPIAEDLEAD